MEKKGLISQAKYFVKDFFAHWNTPPKDDYHVSNKEFVCYSVGGMGVQGFGILTQYTAIVMGAYLSVAYNFDQWVVQITTWIMAIFTIFRAPLLGYIVDNTNTKHGRFKPFLLWGGLAATILLTSLAFIPGLFKNKWTVVMVYQLIYFLAMTAFTLFSYGRVGLAQVITPNTTERTKLYSIGGVIDSLGPSAVQLFFPLIAGAVTGGMNELKTFRLLIPIFGVILSAISLLMFFGTKERMVVAKGKKLHVKFMQGIKKSFKNKYFWIANVSNIAAFGRLAIFSTSIYIAKYLIGGSTGDAVFGAMSTVLGLAFIPGMALAPLIIKKIGKKKMTMISFGGSACISVIMLIFTLTAFNQSFTPWLLYVGLFLNNIFAALFTVTSPAMTADYCDYQQWKTGDRLDGFFANFSTVIITIAGIATGAFTTWLVTRVGAVNATDYANLVILKQLFIIWGIMGIVCGALAIIPYLFWDLDEDKHKKLMDEIEQRRAEEDAENAEAENVENIENAESAENVEAENTDGADVSAQVAGGADGVEPMLTQDGAESDKISDAIEGDIPAEQNVDETSAKADNDSESKK